MKQIIQRLKVLVKIFFGKEFLIKPDIICTKEKFGSDYGGWDVITKGINKSSIVYSFGIGEEASFDIALIKKINLTIHAFDPTPKSIEWVEKQDFPDNFIMHEYGVASFDGTVSFNPPENPDHVSHTLLDRQSTKEQAITVPVKRLITIMKEQGHDKIDILKMDIEGAEYDVINDINKSNIRPQQILIEFHHRFPMVGIEKTKEAIKIIKSMGYHLFSVSAINEEFCFIRKTN
jgi:FkbM family methyltransferase